MCTDAAAPSSSSCARRSALLGAGLTALLTTLPIRSGMTALDGAQRDALSPDDVVTELLDGNARFVSGVRAERDFLAEQRATADGQYPAAAILSCIDSRAPAEIVMDTGIGDVFNARIAGNGVNDDILGSLEFACAVAGAKVIMVLGHTACGAIKGAIDGAQLGHLTGLLAGIEPAVEATAYDGNRTSDDATFVDAVAATHVVRTVEAIRARSAVLRELEDAGTIRIVGAMYDLTDGRVRLIA